MSSLVLRSLGFAAVTLIPVTMAHLEGVEPRLVAGEVLDGLVTTTLFTVVFAAGSLLGPAASSARERRQLFVGAATGVALWSLLWLAWSASAALAPWALLIHCTAIFLAGYLSSRLLHRHVVAAT